MSAYPHFQFFIADVEIEPGKRRFVPTRDFNAAHTYTLDGSVVGRTGLEDS